LVFSRTKHGADRLTRQLEKKQITAVAIHGNKSQGARTKALAAFKKNNVRVLVATDIAARGIDINQLPHVVNFDLPNVPEDYVHRIGRTGRAGETGEAISLVSADEIKQLRDIERLIGRLLERRLIDGFEPDHDVPVTTLNPQKPAPKPGGGSSQPNKKTNYRNRNSSNKNSSNNTNKRGGGQNAQSNKNSTGYKSGTRQS